MGKIDPQTHVLPCLWRLISVTDPPLGELPLSSLFPAQYMLSLLMEYLVFLAQAVAVATTRAEHFVSQEQMLA